MASGSHIAMPGSRLENVTMKLRTLMLIAAASATALADAGHDAPGSRTAPANLLAAMDRAGGKP
jgi:hypothetical protein